MHFWLAHALASNELAVTLQQAFLHAATSHINRPRSVAILLHSDSLVNFDVTITGRQFRFVSAYLPPSSYFDHDSDGTLAPVKSIALERRRAEYVQCGGKRRECSGGTAD